MPQKKNPDAGELLRAKAPRIVGHLQALHGVMHALPLTYNKDLQEDKEHLFDSVDTLRLCLAAATGMIAGARFDRERMSAAASDELIAATDLADLLVKQGTPFRESHGVDRRPRARGGRERVARWPTSRSPRSARTPARCWRSPRGWSPRPQRAGPRWRACASSSSRPARCSPPEPWRSRRPSTTARCWRSPRTWSAASSSTAAARA